jgi:glycine cleavage system H lipoate-binding protein
MRRLPLLIGFVTFGCTLFAQPSRARVSTARVDAVQLRPMPPEMTHRYTVLSSKIQPSAKAWVQQRALLESKKNTLDVASLKADARSHFQAANANLQGADIEAVVFIVLMEASKAAEDDLKTIMGEVKAINNSKQALRDTLNDVNREVAGPDKSSPSAPCNTPLCRSLSARLSQIEAQAPASQKGPRLQVRANPTFADLKVVQNDIKSKLDSMSEMGETESLRLQMVMDRRSRFLDALSNLMKKTSDTSDSVIRNIK